MQGQSERFGEKEVRPQIFLAVFCDEHKDGLWEDMSDRLGGTIFASTAPWVRFHDMRYYLSLVLDQWREAENG